MSRLQRQTGLLLIAIPILFMAAFSGLQMTFEYPDVLRFAPAEVLAKFSAGGAGLIALWYVFMASALAFIPLAVVSALWLWPRHPIAAAFGAVFGILAGLVQGLGLLRWVVLVPALAAHQMTAGADPLQSGINAGVFEAFNLYAGVGVGEHFGYLFTALWTIAFAVGISDIARWLSWAGIVLAIGIAFGMAEPFGLPSAGAINAIAYTVWALWLIVAGITLLRRPAA